MVEEGLAEKHSDPITNECDMNRAQCSQTRPIMVSAMLSFSQDSDRFRQAVERSNAVIEFDMQGNILYANQNFLDLMGYNLSEVKGKKHSIFLRTEEIRSPDYQKFWDDLRSGRFFVAEFGRLHKSGSEVWIKGSYNPVLKHGKPYKVVKIATDITAETLRRAREQSRLSALDRSQAVIEFATDGMIVEVNANFLKTTGYSRDEVIGKHHRLFVDPAEASAPSYAAFWDKLRRGEFEVAEYRRLGKDQREIWIQASYNPIFDGHGKVVGVVKFATDITASKALAARLQRESDEKLAAAVAVIASSIAETNLQASGSASAAVQCSANVQAVAAGSTELAASVGEINNQVMRALETSNSAVAEARQAGATVSSLVDDAKKISTVVDLIASIAAQTNLLALNATIEAARAGEAGRGFAVVAGEVKNLAAQTQRATGEITAHIGAVQASSGLAREAIDRISETIGQINAISVSISAAVEEQAAVTEDMSRNMHEAANGVGMISANMERVAGLTREADENIREIRARAAHHG
jgi:methyl-accepting chemotaxis protein